MQRQVTRREMVRSSALAGVGVWLSGSASASFGSTEPNEKLNIAVIGCGGRGASDLSGVKSENIVALCDVDERRAAESFERYPRDKKYQDFRKMLDQMEKQIDAVVVATPNHIHAPASVMAMRMGKHCYCEKPLTHSVYEARLMAKLATEKNLATQMGTQIHATDNYRRIVEWIAACKTGSPTLCNFDYSGAVTETVLLGNVAYRAGKKLRWDPVNLTSTNCPEADQYLSREYRSGWSL